LGSSKRSTIIDLTKPLDASFIPYSTGNYIDPPLEFSDWSSISRDGFRVTRLSLGTQSGTHIDAPAHFLEDGARLEALLPDHLIGSYFLLSLPDAASFSDVVFLLKSYRAQKILFLRTPENQSAKLSGEAMKKVLSLPAVLLVLSGAIEIEDSEYFTFYRLVAGAAKFLVEDVDQRAAHTISGNGEIFVFPLKLIGVSGSPCRVMARIQKVKTDEKGIY